MAENGTSFGGVIKLTGESSYKKALQSCTQGLKTLASELKYIETSYSSQDKTLEKNEKELQVSNKLYETQTAKIALLQGEYDKLQDSINSNQKKSEELNETLNKQKSLLETLEDTVGKESEEYKKQAEAVQSTEKAIIKLNDSTLTMSTNQGKIAEQLYKTKTESHETEQNIKKLSSEIEKTNTVVWKSKESFNDLSESMKKSDTSVGGLIDKFKNMKASHAIVIGAIVAVTKAVADLSVKFINAMKDLATWGDSIDKTADKLSMTKEQYQELAYVARQTDMEMSNLQIGMKNITQTMDTVASGTSKAKDAFGGLGIAIYNTDGSIKKAGDVLYDTIYRLADIQDETKRASYAYQVFGRNYKEILPLLNQGSKGIEKLRQEAHKYGVVLSDEVIANSSKFSDSMAKLGDTFNAFKYNILSEFLPSITAISDSLADGIIGADGWQESIKNATAELTKGIKGMIDKVKPLLYGLTDVVIELLPDFTSVLIDVATEAFTVLVGKIPDIIASVIAKAPNLITGIVKSVLGIVPAVISGLIDGILGIIDRQGKALESAEDKLAKYEKKIAGEEKKREIEKQLKDTGKAVITTIDGVEHEILSGTELFVDENGTLWASYSEEIKKQAKNIQASTEKITGLSKLDTTKSTDIMKAPSIDDLIENSKNSVKTGMQEIGNATEDESKELSNTIENLIDEYRNLWGTAEKTKNNFDVLEWQNKVAEAYDTAGEMGEAQYEVVKGIVAQLDTAERTTDNQIDKWLLDTVKNFSNTSGQLQQEVKKTVEKVQEYIPQYQTVNLEVKVNSNAEQIEEEAEKTNTEINLLADKLQNIYKTLGANAGMIKEAYPALYNLMVENGVIIEKMTADSLKLEELQEDILAGGDKAIEIAQQGLDTIMKQKSISGALLDMYGSYSKEQLEELKKTSPQIAELLKEHTDLFETTQELYKEWQAIQQAMASGDKAQIQDAILAYTEAQKELAEKSKSSWQKFIDTFNADPLVQKIREFSKVFEDLLVKPLYDLSKISVEVTQSIISGFGEAVNLIAEYAQAMTSEFPEFNLIEKIFGINQDSLDVIINQLPELIEGLESRIPEIAEMLKDTLILLIQNIIPVLVEAIPEIIPALVDVISTLLTVLTDYVVSNLPDILNAIMDGLIELIPELVEKMIVFAVNAVQGLIENLPRIIFKIFELIAKIIAKIFESIWDLLTGGWRKKAEEEEKKAQANANAISNKLSKSASSFSQNSAMLTEYWESKMRQQEKEIYNNLVNGFKAALGQMEIKLNGEEVGRYVEKTVQVSVYNGNSITQSIRMW